MTAADGRGVPHSVALRALAFLWGFCAFLPIGVMYVSLLLMLAGMAFAPALGRRLARLPRQAVFWPMLLMLAWSVLAALAGPWLEDTPTRLFHLGRVVLVVCLGLLLEPREARFGLAGFLVAALVAALVVALHRIWTLPPWPIWASLLTSRNNFSSGNMISMAIASGVCLVLALHGGPARQDRWLALAAAAALALTVALHAVSRNALLLLVLIAPVALWCRYRSWRALGAAGLALLVTAAALWQFAPTARARFLELVQNVQAVTSGTQFGTSGGLRWRMFQEAWQGMLEHPWLGTGVGTWLPHWSATWMAMDVEVDAETKRHFANINNPHNDFLLAGMETGIPGLLLLAWVLWRFARLGWRPASASGDITVMMAVALFATCLVNAPLRDAALGMTLLWLLGASVAAHGGTRRE